MSEQRTSDPGLGFAFFRWHCLMWPTIIDCSTFHAKKCDPECVLRWRGGIK